MSVKWAHGGFAIGITRENDCAAIVPALSLGFQYDPTGINPIITAVQDVETDLPRLNAAFEAAGINEVIADVQAQYDAWKAATAE